MRVDEWIADFGSRILGAGLRVQKIVSITVSKAQKTKPGLCFIQKHECERGLPQR